MFVFVLLVGGEGTSVVVELSVVKYGNIGEPFAPISGMIFKKSLLNVTIQCF